MLQLTIRSTYVDTFRVNMPLVVFVYLNESTGIGDGGEDTGIPRVTSLMQNTPNPFNPSTVIGFNVNAGGKVLLEIYDVRGRRIRRLMDDRLGAGKYQVTWDGKDDRGRALPSGVYLYRLEASGDRFTRKMLLAK
jgi:hypothetical protein